MVLKEYIKYKYQSKILQRVVKGTSWNVVGTVIFQVSSLMISIILANILGKNDFGEISFIRNTYIMLGQFACLGIDVAVTKYISEWSTTNRVYIQKLLRISRRSVVISGLITTTVLIIFSNDIVERWFNHNTNTNSLLCGVGLIIVNALYFYQNGVLSGFHSFKEIAKIEVFRAVLIILMPLVGAYWYGVNGALLGYIIMGGCSYFITEKIIVEKIKKYKTKPAKIDKNIFLVLVKFSLPVFTSGLFVISAIWGCNVLLINNENKFGEIGVFNIALTWKNLILFIPLLLSKVFFPILSELYAKKDYVNFNKLTLYFKVAIVLISIGISIFMTLCSELILSLYGNEFVGHGTVLNYIAYATSFQALAIVFAQSILSTGNTKIAFYLNTIWAVSVIIIFALLPKSALGLSQAYFYSYLMHWLISLFYYLYFRYTVYTNQIDRELNLNP